MSATVEDDESAPLPSDSPFGDASTTLRVAVGNPFRPPGRTVVEVGRDGSWKVETFLRDEAVRDAGLIDADRAALILRAAGPAICAVDIRGVAPPLEDEAMYFFEILQGAETVIGIALPERAVERNEGVVCVLRALSDSCAGVLRGGTYSCRTTWPRTRTDARHEMGAPTDAAPRRSILDGRRRGPCA